MQVIRELISSFSDALKLVSLFIHFQTAISSNIIGETQLYFVITSMLNQLFNSNCPNHSIHLH